MLNVGIIGFGTIGQDVAQAILQGNAGQVQLKAILVRDETKYPDTSSHGYVMTSNEEVFFVRGWMLWWRALDTRQ